MRRKQRKRGIKTKSARRGRRRGRVWSAAQARARLGHLLDEAAAGRPQRIARRGRTVAVLVAAAEPPPKTKLKTSLLEFFRNSPLAELSDEEHERMFKRNKDTRLRRIDLGE
jgi:prevent-host-death family protein